MRDPGAKATMLDIADKYDLMAQLAFAGESSEAAQPIAREDGRIRQPKFKGVREDLG